MTSINLTAANYQWSTRPDDERFENLQDMHTACLASATASVTKAVPRADLRAVARDEQLKIAGRHNEANVTHYAFGQLSRFAGAPADFLRALPATLAADVLNDRLANVREGGDLQILFGTNGGISARAITSDAYDRIWNHEVISRGLVPMAADGWRVPPARPARAGQRGTRRATRRAVRRGFGSRARKHSPRVGRRKF